MVGNGQEFALSLSKGGELALSLSKGWEIEGGK